MKPITVGLFHFNRPVLGVLFLLLPAAIYLYWVVLRRRRRTVIQFAAVDLLVGLKTGPSWKRHANFILAMLVSGLLIISAMDPAIEGSYLASSRQVVLVVDVSKSMEANDVAPTRLAAAQAAAQRFVETLPIGYEIGLVSFSGTVNILSTPTMDRKRVGGLIRGLSTVSGTATGDAIIQTLGVFGDNPKGGVVVLLSDGAQNAGLATIEQAAGALKSAGVKVYAIALGTDAGRISLIDPNTGEAKTVEVPPDPAGLTLLTSITGGDTFEAVTIDELNTVYDAVGNELEPIKGLVNIGWIMSIVALTLIAAGGLLSYRWGRTY